LTQLDKVDQHFILSFAFNSTPFESKQNKWFFWVEESTPCLPIAMHFNHNKDEVLIVNTQAQFDCKED